MREIPYAIPYSALEKIGWKISWEEGEEGKEGICHNQNGSGTSNLPPLSLAEAVISEDAFSQEAFRGSSPQI